MSRVRIPAHDTRWRFILAYMLFEKTEYKQKEAGNGPSKNIEYHFKHQTV